MTIGQLSQGIHCLVHEHFKDSFSLHICLFTDQTSDCLSFGRFTIWHLSLYQKYPSIKYSQLNPYLKYINFLMSILIFIKVMTSSRFQGQQAQPKALPVIKLSFLRPFNYKNIISCRNQTHADKLTFMLTG